MKGGPWLPLTFVCGRCLFLENEFEPEQAGQGHEALQGKPVRVGFKFRKAVLADAQACRGGRLGHAKGLASSDENLPRLLRCGESDHGVYRESR